MKCTKFKNLLIKDDLSVVERFSFVMHFLLCSSCRNIYKSYYQKLGFIHDSSPCKTELRSETIMRAVILSTKYKDDYRSYHFYWFITDLILSIGAMIIGESLYYSNIVAQSGRVFPILLFMLFAICIIIISIIYVGSHIKELKKFFRV